MVEASSVSIGQLRDLYEGSQFSIRQIEELTGIPYTTVHGRLIAAGVKLRQPGGNHRFPSHEEYARTAFMYEVMKLSTSEIADELGLQISTVCNRLKVHGVEMRARGESARLRFARRPQRKSRKVVEPIAA